MPNVFLGIDGGGTKTTACLIDDTHNVNREITGGPTNYHAIGFDAAYQNLKDVIHKVLNGLQVTDMAEFFALSGIDTPRDRQHWYNAIIADDSFWPIPRKPNLEIANDVVAALRSGTVNPNACVVICGTGSVAYGTNSNKEVAKTGGMKHLLSDEGSGYALGLGALHAVTRELDGRGDKTELTQELFHQHNINSLEELHDLVYAKPWGKTEVASLVPVVEKAAGKGDTLAQRLCSEAVGELLLATRTVIRRLNLSGKPFDLVLAGSILTTMPLIREPFAKSIADEEPQMTFCEPQMSYAKAAALLARERVAA